jgi:hypothetical protein
MGSEAEFAGLFMVHKSCFFLLFLHVRRAAADETSSGAAVGGFLDKDGRLA